jgi:SWI/SNF-related matrix-associated actin-dependent regulator 1 of chromatin subfamily A
MLNLIKDRNGNRKWYVESAELRKNNIRSPQGFTFEFAQMGSNYFWTTDEFAAYLFYRRHNLASPMCVANFKQARKKEQELYELSYATEINKTFPTNKGVAFYPYQNAGIEYCLRAGSALIADSMRIGKTATAIGVINSSPDIKKVLILCPKTAKLVWIKELQTFLSRNMSVQVLGAQSKINRDADILIMNYDNLAIQSELGEIDFDLIVPDEIHGVKNQKTQRAKFFFALKGRKRIGLSGTPLLNKPKDLLTVLKWIDPFWESFYIYKEQFATKSGITLSLEEVKDLIRSSVMIRREQSQVFSTEPIERRIVPLEIPEHLKDDILIEKNGYKKAWLLKDYTKARKLIGLGRVPAAVNHILTYTSECTDKMVVFAWHKEVINRIAASLGSKAVIIYGDTTDTQRKDNIERFKNDPNCSVIIGSIPAMSMAINLSVANHVLFVEQDYSEGLMEQAEERCSDKNQIHPVLVEYLCYENSLDYHMMNIRLAKETNSDHALNVLY